MLFCHSVKKYTQTEVRHELVHILPSNPNGSTSPSPSRFIFNCFEIDQRLKSNREELLSLQYSSLSLAIPLDRGRTTSPLLMNQKLFHVVIY